MQVIDLECRDTHYYITNICNKSDRHEANSCFRARELNKLENKQKLERRC